jgi:hypothetical protein
MYEMIEWSKEEIRYGEQSSDSEAENLFEDSLAGHVELWAPQNMLQMYKVILNLKLRRVTLWVTEHDITGSNTCECKGSNERHVSC